MLQGGATGGLLGGTLDTMQGEDPAKAYSSNFFGGVTAAGAANLASKFAPGPLKLPAALAAAFFSYSPATDMFKGFYDKTIEMFGRDPGTTSSQPINSKVPDIAFNPENLMGDGKQKSDIASESQKQDFTQPAQYGEIEVSQLMGAESIQLADAFSSTTLKTPLAEIVPIKQEATMKAQSVGPLPEPTPTIIPMPMGGSTASRPKSSNQSSDSATSVPSIDPENPNNFYVVYSHSVYNVPMT